MSNVNHFKMKPQLEVKLEFRVAFNAQVQIPVYWWDFRLLVYFQLYFDRHRKWTWQFGHRKKKYSVLSGPPIHLSKIYDHKSFKSCSLLSNSIVFPTNKWIKSEVQRHSNSNDWKISQTNKVSCTVRCHSFYNFVIVWNSAVYTEWEI